VISADRPKRDLPYRIVFILGCARSGTTWLQLLLHQHPLIVSSQETTLFSDYLSHLAKSWGREEDHKADQVKTEPSGGRQAPARAADRRRHAAGLSGILAPAEFDEMMRDFALGVFGKIAASKPSARVVVEKTPAHAFHKDLILRLFPNAQFIHMVRDPRSVVVSVRQAANLAGFDWARTSVVSGAKYWRTCVQASRQFSEATANYREIHYEQLHADGPAQLHQLLSWLEVDSDREFCERAIARCNIENLRNASAEVAAPWSLESEPTKFFRRGATDGWRDELSSGEIRAVEHVAGDIMESFGYERSVPISRKPVRVSIHDALEKSLHGLVNAVATFSPRLVRAVRDSLKRQYGATARQGETRRARRRSKDASYSSTAAAIAPVRIPSRAWTQEMEPGDSE